MERYKKEFVEKKLEEKGSAEFIIKLEGESLSMIIHNDTIVAQSFISDNSNAYKQLFNYCEKFVKKAD